MNPSLTIFDDSIAEFIRPDFDVETLLTDCQFTEGPVWHSDGYYLFSDISANVIYKLIPGKSKEIYINNSGTINPNDEDLKPGQGGSDGLAFDKNGYLLVCRHGSHMIARWENNQLVPLLTTYNSRPFNSPNDLVVDAQNRLIFSDPPYGLKEAQPKPEKYQPVSGVYCFDGENIRLFCDSYQYPNGVCITPDGKSLYISSTKPFEKRVSVYNLATLQFEKILAEENSDGIKCDRHGAVYLSTKEGILILNKKGKRLGLISFATIPANHCFGGENNSDLFVTGRENVYLLRNLVR